jgi:hypothetical protein
MSAIALSRSVAEYAIRDNAPRLHLELTYERNGTKHEKSFSDIINELSPLRPELARHLETIRSTGNRILHPKNPKSRRGAEIISMPRGTRGEASKCLTHTKVVIEILYAS